MSTENVKYELSLRDLMSKGLNDINAKMARVEGGLGRAERQAKKTSSSFSGLGSALAGLGLGAVGLNIIQATAKFQSMSNAIKFASDNAIQGGLSLNWLSDFSNKWGLNLEGATEGFKTFQGAMLKTKFSSNEVRKMFSQVSMGAVAMGLSSEDAKGTFLALGQIMGKGKVQAEELRGQIGERVPGAFAIAARAMGVTTAALDKMMKDGQLLSEDFLPKFAAEMEKTFSAGALDNVGSMTSNINRLSNSWLELQTSMGESQGGLINSTLSGWTILLGKIADQFRDINQLSGRSSNENTINLMAEMESRMKNKRASLEKKGLSRSAIEEQLRVEQLTAQSSFGIQKLRLEEKLKVIEAKKINPKEARTAGALLGLKDVYGSQEGLYKGDKEYKTLFDQLTSLKNAEGGMQGIADKEISNMYDDGKKKAAADALAKQVSDVSGGAPKVVNITIEALIKDVKNYFSSSQNAMAESKNFLDQLQEALGNVIADTSILQGNGR